MPPYVFIENDRFSAIPTVDKTFVRKGPAAKEFEAIDVLPTLTKKAVDFIAQHGAKEQKKPFFLYLPLTAPHGPIVPVKDWQGKSGLNPYGDFVMQTDDTLGKVLDALDKACLADNTLVVMASDNGCALVANIPELLMKGHNPSYLFRGQKADIYDGGHHIPFIVRWPGKVKAGAQCDQLICLNDLFATLADMLGAKLPENTAEDSVSILPALLGKAERPLREAVVHHSANGSFAIRQGKWKLELCPGSGGWSKPRPGQDGSDKLPPIQLYDLEKDIGETTNLHDKETEVVARLTKLLEKYVADGRSTPGAPQKNTGEVDIWKAGREAMQLQKKSK